MSRKPEGNSSSRRDFLRLAATSTVAAGFAPAVLASRRTQTLKPETRRGSANDRIQLATIGMGIQGHIDTQSALRTGDIELVAVADCYDGRLAHAKEMFGNGVATTRDFREILARPDVDAVIVATSDHWHAQIAIEAMRAGKDVYLEKPMVQDIEEGPQVMEVARETGRILQVGSQRVSSLLSQKAKEMYEAGAIGELNMVQAKVNRNSALGAWQYTLPVDASPETIDWDRFLGNAPQRPFDPVRFFRWRNYWDYGTGVPGDLFVHLFSGVHYILGSNGPSRVMSTGGLRYWQDERDVPDIMVGLYDYPATDAHPAFNLVMQVNLADGSGGGDESLLIGSEGTISVGWGSVILRRQPRAEVSEDEIFRGYNSVFTYPKEGVENLLADWRQKNPNAPVKTQNVDVIEEKFDAPRGYNEHLEHHKNFFEAVRTRVPVVEDAAFGYRAAAPCILTNRSYREEKIYTWDPESMKVVS